jgi:hypothetical protein
VAVATGSAILLIDGGRRTSQRVSDDGGDRVSLGLGWIAWSSAAHLHLARVAEAPADRAPIVPR